MKKMLCYAVMILSGVCTLHASANDYKYLTLQNLNGEENSLSLNGLTLTFADGNLQAKQNGAVRTYALAALSKMYLSNSATGISSVEAKRTAVSLSGSTLKIQAPQGTQARVFDAQGRVVLSTTIGKDGAPASVSLLLPGIYTVKAGSETLKILVK